MWIQPLSKPTKPRRDKKSTAAAEALGRSRGGFGTKVHAVVAALGNCLFLTLTPAELPPKTSRLPYDHNLYADRNKSERFFGRLKEARGSATHYEKTAASFLATAHLLAALNWMR